ncbi:hypothetical protein [Bdellovibrio sp. BCCA]|uniref:hypothetical protein n=1 Tax=Bdellovibrio sp. BCCA TaxID=3136281 RepID=UPI0030F160B4
MNTLNATTGALRVLKAVKSVKTEAKAFAIYYGSYDNDVMDAISALDLGAMEDDNGYDIDVDCGGQPKKVRQGNWIVYDKDNNKLEVLEPGKFKAKYVVVKSTDNK